MSDSPDDGPRGDQRRNEPDLELPSLSLPGFRRRKRRDKPRDGQATPDVPEASARPQPADAPKVAGTPPGARTQSPPATATEVRDEPAAGQTGRRKQPRGRSEGLPAVRLPTVKPPVAAGVTGVLCGLLACALSWLAAGGCEAVRGVGSCGGFGLVALVAILAITVLLGAALLKAWRVNDPASTSFLGVGLVAVIAMLFFLDAIDSVWMVLVIPLLTAAMFLLSWWVTDTFVEGADD